MPHPTTRRSEQNGGEVAHLAEPDVGVGRPGRGVEVVDVEGDQRRGADHHLLDDAREHRHGQPAAAQLGGQPDPLQLGAPERQAADVGLEHHPAALDDDVGVAAGRERRQ